MIRELLGGDLVVADIAFKGQIDGIQYWNVFPNGQLIRDQLLEEESFENRRRVPVSAIFL